MALISKFTRWFLKILIVTMAHILWKFRICVATEPNRTELNSIFDQIEPESNTNPNSISNPNSNPNRTLIEPDLVRVRSAFGSRLDSVRVQFGFGWVKLEFQQYINNNNQKNQQWNEWINPLNYFKFNYTHKIKTQLKNALVL